MNIAHSVILITAAGSPLGKALSLHFASLGAKLALVDERQHALGQTLQACQAVGASCQSYLIPDLSERTIATLINNVHQHFGRIEVLVNCWVGSELPSLLSPSSVDQFSRSMSEKATPFFTFGKQTAHYMRDHNCPGVIINLAANEDCQHNYIHSGSKAIVSGLTQSWAKELAEFNIRVGGVVPLTIDCPCNNHHHKLSSPLQYEIARSAEYIVANDYFNGRMIEAEVS
ncbi:short-chain dehydrogenase [Photobacterium gaetbulicola]|uniref:Short chain dehydrogenase n=1 Tax=Photobacterium gaetbulicola Gung47 TaxID=658445 RepID=A0A0C5WY48_9GAMM|nr:MULTISPECIES: SDR family oxidoreductase [Photobacterium]AJR07985.1 short chain dehydrogenase [Photobacterium gaetbulicola Gung47]PSU07796.1 short-chain dehydrogenase [Photobacterium gaetbulicola]WEM43177.1 SDR family oxidoreductase [Photobacterium sp. DA100]